MSDEQQIAALREEIRQAGRSWARIGWVNVAGVALVGLGASLTFYASAHLLLIVHLGGSFGVRSGPGWAWLFWDYRHALATLGGVGLAALTGGFVRYWRVVGRRLQAKVMRLPAAQAEQLLGSLRTGTSSARLLVAPILRSWRPATELSPGVVPDARGDEASPAEKAT